MEHFCCPRCLAVSWSQDDVAAGYCGACHDVTRIEGLTVRLHWRAGEWECKPCDLAYISPGHHSYPPQMCGQCERAMTQRLSPEVTIDQALFTERSRREADMYLGQRTGGRQLRALRGERPLRNLAEGGADWYMRAQELAERLQLRAAERELQETAEPRPYTGGDYARLVRTAEHGPDSAAERARRLIDRMRRRYVREQPAEPPRTLGERIAGDPVVRLSRDVAVGWRNELSAPLWLDENGWDIQMQPYEELAAETLENMRNLAGLTMTASGTLTPEQFATAMGLLGVDLPPAPEAVRPARDESPLGSLTPAEIDRLLGVNQTVMRGLILNHSPSAGPDGDDIPWSDPASWSPGDTEL